MGGTRQILIYFPPDIRMSKNYMLHDCDTLHEIGKYKGNDFRTAALKACSKNAGRDLKYLLLRETSTKKWAKFSWKNVELDTPKVVTKGAKQIIYKRTPTVELMETFTAEIPEEPALLGSAS